MNRTLYLVAATLLLGCPGPSPMDAGTAGGTAGSGTGGGRAGGSTAGGNTAGGTATAGGATAGGATAGGATAGGATAGGATAGGATAGGATAGGATAGGATAGGSTAGGSTAGGATAGGSTAGGSTAGGSTAGGSASPIDGGFLPIDQACNALAYSYCQRFATCGSANNVASCIAVLTSFSGFTSCLGPTAEAVDAGRQRYDGFAAGDCVTRVMNLSCTYDLGALNYVIPSCNQIVVGLSSNGGVCQASDDCDPASWCRISSGVCGGLCEPRAADGTAPIAGAECARTSTLYEGRCRAPADGGQYCGQSDGGSFLPQQCWPGYFCDSQSVRCQPQKAIGQPCNNLSGSECSSSAFCFMGTCHGPQSVGQQCATIGYCQFDAWCSHQRDGGASCSSVSQAGGPCESNSSCYPLQRCAGLDGGFFVTGTCAAPAPAGAPCLGNPGDCGAGLYCAPSVPRRCQPQLPSGSSCGAPDDCLTGICGTPIDAGSSVCRPNYQCF